MKAFRIVVLIGVFLFLFRMNSYATMGTPATDEDILRLKQDLIGGKLHVGITRLKDLMDQYGEPNKKVDGDKKVELQYGDLKIEFDKKRYWREWGYDSDKKPAYTDKINTLRKKLAGQKIDGKNIPIEKFIKDYDEPTEIYLTAEDGQISVYYYGEMKLTFENVFTLKNWEAKNLNQVSGVLQSVPPPAAPPVAKAENPPMTTTSAKP